MSFQNLDLIDELLMALGDLGFREPTPIQTDAIPEIISGKNDLVGLAQTGTGKTAAFALPMIQLTDFSLNRTQGVVLCPTRELCRQITKDYMDFCKYIKKPGVVAVYGGSDMMQQIKSIKKGASIIIATPGRLLDMINRKIADLSDLRYLVLDEADEMLNMGFQEDIDAILSATGKNKRVWLFSATMPRGVAAIASRYLKNPVEVTIGTRNRGAENIVHHYYLIKERDRYFALKRVIDYYPEIYGLVFCRTRSETQDIAEKLIRDGYSAEALHGDLSQHVRDKVMKRFRERNIRILIATDVAARGIDVQNISHVINYRLPDESENYTHRSGRTGRAGKSGTSIAFINTKERRKLGLIENKAGIRFVFMKTPSGYSVCEKQLFGMVDRLVSVEVNETEIEKFLPPVYNTLGGLSREELIKRFVSLEFNRFLSYYKNASDLNISNQKKETADSEKGKRKKKPISGKSFGNRKRFFMTAGTLDNLKKGTVVRVVCDKAGIKAAGIGNIEIMREFSFFEVDRHLADKVLMSMKEISIDGKKVSVRPAEQKKTKKKKKKKATG